MSQHLVLRLGAAANNPVNYAVVGETGEDIIESGTLRNVDEIELLRPYFKSDVIVLLPAGCFFYKKLTYPKRFSSSMKGTIPFMIEDDVASEVDSLEVVVLNNGGKQVDIMAYDKSYNEYVQSVMDKYGLLPSKILVDIFALPYNDGEVTVVNLAGEFLFRDKRYSGFSLNQSLATQYFKSMESMPKFLCLSEIPWNAEKNPAFVALPMGELAKGALKSKITLKDAERSQKKMFVYNKVMKPWIKVAAVLLALILVAYVGLISKYIALNRENTALKADMVAVFKQKFPGTTRVVNPMAQFKQLTNQTGDAEHEQSFIKRLGSMLGSFGSQAQMLTFSYDDNRHRYNIKLAYKELDDIEGIKNALISRGYKAEISDIKTDKDGKRSAIMTVEEA